MPCLRRGIDGDPKPVGKNEYRKGNGKRIAAALFNKLRTVRDISARSPRICASVSSGIISSLSAMRKQAGNDIIGMTMPCIVP